MLATAARHLAGSLRLRAAPAGTYALQHTFATSAAGPSDSEVHDDFKPQVKAAPSASVAEQIEQDVKGNKVFLYMKGSPDAPQCGFSNMACRILDAYGVEYGSRNVLQDPDLREGVKKYSEWPTIPQVFVDGEFIGGSDILMNLHESGDLKKMFLDKQ